MWDVERMKKWKEGMEENLQGQAGSKSPVVPGGEFNMDDKESLGTLQGSVAVEDNSTQEYTDGSENNSFRDSIQSATSHSILPPPTPNSTDSSLASNTPGSGTNITPTTLEPNHHKITTMSNTENREPLKRGRKRKLGSEPPKQKRARVAPEAKKAPACKSCYKGHVGCERASEAEACQACIKKGVSCEVNDVKVVKGVKIIKVEEGGGFNITSASKAEEEQEMVEEDGVECEKQPSKKVDVAGGDREEEITGVGKSESGSSKEISKLMTATYAKMTEQEQEVVRILAGMGEVEFELLDRETSVAHFKAIEGALSNGGGDGESAQEASKMLNELKWQYFWLDKYVRDGSGAPSVSGYNLKL
ncbi:hypothetical protein ABW20_dc0109111 [Dactylellina cionopaga]|nr:hypothetical protein ABW20_dc0109111 [Dactylellina cionopaga]